MKLTIDEIDALFNKAEKSKTQLLNDIDLLRNNAKALHESAQKAAEAGDLERYKKLKADAANVEAELFVKEAQLKAATRPVSSEDIKNAWKEYASKRDKDLELKIKEFEKHRNDLAKEFRSLTDFQADTLRERNHLANYIGIQTENLDVFGNPSEIVLADFPVKTIPKRNQLKCGGMMIMSDDAKYFFASGLIKSDEIDYYHNVITHNKV